MKSGAEAEPDDHHTTGRSHPSTPTEPRRLVGYLGRAGIMRARVRLYEEENLRERGARAAGGAPAA
jgi:hypothetical protein